MRKRLVHSGYDAPPSSATARGLLVDEDGLRGASNNDTPASAATAGRFVVLGEVRLGLGDRIDVEAVHCEFGLWTWTDVSAREASGLAEEKPSSESAREGFVSEFIVCKGFIALVLTVLFETEIRTASPSNYSAYQVRAEKADFQ